MPKQENPKRNLAFQIYAMNEGRISVGEIAEQLGLTYQQVASWKSRGQWDLQLELAKAVMYLESAENNGASPEDFWGALGAPLEVSHKL